SQTSCTSHWPADARHTAPCGFTASGGQSGLLPSHDSATSQTSLAFRQTPLCANWSAGQSMFVPSQYSATSHTPAGERHRAPWLPATWWQTPNVVSQVSTVQGFWSSQAGSFGLFFEQ